MQSDSQMAHAAAAAMIVDHPEQHQPAQGHPTPPYTEADDASLLGDGIKCYYEGCESKLSSYCATLKHVRKMHKAPIHVLRNTYLLKCGNNDISEQQKKKELRKHLPRNV